MLKGLAVSEHAHEVSVRGCRISRVRHTRPNMPARYQDGAAGSHGLGTPDRLCLQSIRTGLQNLTGKEHQIVRAYEVPGWGWMILRGRNIRLNMPTRYQVGAAGSHGLGTTERTYLLCIRSGLQDLMGSKHQIERIYDVFGTTDHTYLRGIRTGLQDLTGWVLQIVHAY